MYNRLRMNQHLNLFRRHAKQPLRFNDFEAFVHHRCRINGDLCAHLPIRVFECIGSRYRRHLLQRKRTERTTRSCQQNLLNRIVSFADDRLENGGMFAVHRQNRRMVLLREFANEFACYDERFLVRQSNRFACLYRLHRRTQTGIADHCGNHDVNARGSDHLRNGIRSCPNLDFSVSQCFLELRIKTFVCNAHHFRSKLNCLIDKQLHVMIRTNGIDFKPLGIAANHIQSLRTN